jgi:hypothetical protein
VRLTRVLATFFSVITPSTDVMQTTKRASHQTLESSLNLPAELQLLAAIAPKRRQNATRSSPVVGAKGGIFDANYVLLVEPQKTSTGWWCQWRVLGAEPQVSMETTTNPTILQRVPHRETHNPKSHMCSHWLSSNLHNFQPGCLNHHPTHNHLRLYIRDIHQYHIPCSFRFRPQKKSHSM